MRRPDQKREKNIVGRPFSLRDALERHLAANGREVTITKNPLLVKSNKMLECKLNLNRREGKENVRHKPVIQKQDIVKLKGSPFLSFNDPAGLLRRVWFIVRHNCFCRRSWYVSMRSVSMQYLRTHQCSTYDQHSWGTYHYQFQVHLYKLQRGIPYQMSYLQQGLHRRNRKTPGRLIQRTLTFNTTNQH